MAALAPFKDLIGLLDRGEIDRDAFLEHFVRLLVTAIGCSRAGIWVFADLGPERVSRCLVMYDSNVDGLVEVSDMTWSGDRPYFDALMRDGCVVAPDARSNPATAVFLDDYLLPLDIRSLMDVCFSVNGALHGSFSCEQVGRQVDWTAGQLQLLRQIAASASLALVRAANTEIDTAPAALWDPTAPNRLTGRRSSDQGEKSDKGDKGDKT